MTICSCVPPQVTLPAWCLFLSGKLHTLPQSQVTKSGWFLHLCKVPMEVQNERKGEFPETPITSPLFLFHRAQDLCLWRKYGFKLISWAKTLRWREVHGRGRLYVKHLHPFYCFSFRIKWLWHNFNLMGYYVSFVSYSPVVTTPVSLQRGKKNIQLLIEQVCKQYMHTGQ